MNKLKKAKKKFHKKIGCRCKLKIKWSKLLFKKEQEEILNWLKRAKKIYEKNYNIA